MEDYTVIAGEEKWTRNTMKGAQGLADYLTYKGLMGGQTGKPASVYLTEGLKAGGRPEDFLLYVGKAEVEK